MSNESTSRRAWLGIGILLIGATFLARNLGFIPHEIEIYLGWELLFIFIGTAMLISGKSGGLIFLLIGGFFLLQDITHFYFRMRDWWPIILIVIGVSILLRQAGRGKGDSSRIPKGSRDTDTIDDVNIFGGGSKNITSKNFKGGKVTSIFGGADLNFHDAIPAPENAVIDLFTMFGGCTLYVPSDWTVRMEEFSLFGGFSDNRRNVKADSNKVLIVKGLVIFGGGEIKTA